MMRKLHRMLDADVLFVAEAAIWNYVHRPHDEADEILGRIMRKRERDRLRRALTKTLPGANTTGMLPTEKRGRKPVRFARLEWELTELFQYVGLDQKDAAWCADALLRENRLIPPPVSTAHSMRKRTCLRPSAVPARCDNLERKLQKARTACAAAEDAFIAASKRGEAEKEFSALNAASEKYLRLQKLAEHPHVANTVKMLQLLRGHRPEVAARVMARRQNVTKK